MNKEIKNIYNKAKKYTLRQDFRKNDCGAYVKAYRLGILDEVCAHMRQKWTKEAIAKIAKKYTVLKKFKIENQGAYSTAYSNGWLNEITTHMTKNVREGKWNKENIRLILPQFSSITEFANKKGRAYLKAIKLGMNKELYEFYNFKDKIWTEDEKNILKNNHKKLNNLELANKIQRSEMAVQKKKMTLGLSRRKWLVDEKGISYYIMT